MVIPKALINKREHSAEEAQELEAYQIQVAARLAYWREFDGRRKELLPDVRIIRAVNQSMDAQNRLQNDLRAALRDGWRIAFVTESCGASSASGEYVGELYWNITYTLVKNIPANEPY